MTYPLYQKLNVYSFDSQCLEFIDWIQIYRSFIISTLSVEPVKEIRVYLFEK